MKALILAGGLSKRMGRNKALIERPDGKRQIDFIVDLVRPFVDSILLSTQSPEIAPDGIEILPDLHPGAGPLAALEAFHAKHPGEPVLVLGCDLFLLDAETLRFLIERHEPGKIATCYLNRIDERPEPLCTIYQPAALELAANAISTGHVCARHFLEDLNPQALSLPHPVALDNTNNPSELDEAFAKLKHSISVKSIRTLYFAKLKEMSGLDSESIDTVAHTAAGLFHDLSFKHRFKLPIDSVRCARNGDFCDWSTPLQDGDEIVFIPPVAGG